MPQPKQPMVETHRVKLLPEEHARLGELVRAAEDSKAAATQYIDQLGRKYSAQLMIAGECSMQFHDGDLIVMEPQMVLRAT